MNKIWYECDPTKNKKCKSSMCFVRGGACHETSNIDFKKEILRVKDVTFFYNTDLLQQIVHEKENHVHLSYDFIKNLMPEDLVKFTGCYVSCIVKIINIGPKDYNRYCDVEIALKRVLPGELEIAY